MAAGMTSDKAGVTDVDLSNRVILITGAGGGLGSVVATAAAQAGAELILVGRRLKPLEKVYDAITAQGGPEPALFPLDFTKAGADDYQRLIDGISNDCGRLDGIVHLAARFDGLRPLYDYDVADWQRSLHVNLTAPFAITESCIPLLRAAPDASVIFASDRTGRDAKPYWGAYAVAKAGLDTAVKLFAAEYEHLENLRFNAVDPGPLLTLLRKKAFPMDDPEGREPKVALAPFLHLLGPESRGTTGQILTNGKQT